MIYSYSVSGEFSKEFRTQRDVCKNRGIRDYSLCRAIKSGKPINGLYYSKDRYDNFLTRSDEMNEIDSEIESRGIDKDKISQIWHKGKRISIQEKFDNKLDVEQIIEELKNVLEDSVVPETYTKVEASNKSIVCISSDKHIGMEVSENSIYINPWDKKIFGERMNYIYKAIREKAHINGSFENCILVDLGDMTDGYNGETTRGGHKLPQNLSTEEQFNVAFEYSKMQIDYLISSSVANRYTLVFQCNSNHSATIDYMVARAMEIYCGLKYSNVEIVINQKHLDYFTIYDHTYIYTHGKDSVDMKGGLPKVLDNKTEVYINDYIRIKKLGGRISVIKGNDHISGEQYAKNFRYKNIPALSEPSKWVQTNFGMGSAGFTMEVVNSNDNKIDTITEFFN